MSVERSEQLGADKRKSVGADEGGGRGGRMRGVDDGSGREVLGSE